MITKILQLFEELNITEFNINQSNGTLKVSFETPIVKEKITSMLSKEFTMDEDDGKPVFVDPPTNTVPAPDSKYETVDHTGDPEVDLVLTEEPKKSKEELVQEQTILSSEIAEKVERVSEIQKQIKKESEEELVVEEDQIVETKVPKKYKKEIAPNRLGKTQDMNDPEFYKQRSKPNLSLDPNLEEYIKYALENGVSAACRKYSLASSSLSYHIKRYKENGNKVVPTTRTIGYSKEELENYKSSIGTSEEPKKEEELLKEEVKKPEKKHFSDESPLTGDKTLYKDHKYTEDEVYYIKAYLARKIKPKDAADALNMDTRSFNLLAGQYSRSKNITGAKKPTSSKPVEPKEVKPEKPKFDTTGLSDGWQILTEDNQFHLIEGGVVVK